MDGEAGDQQSEGIDRLDEVRKQLQQKQKKQR